MNALRTMSRVLVVTTVVFVGNACGDYNAIAAKHLYQNKFTTFAALLESKACKKDEHFKKAAIDTLGHTLDAIAQTKEVSNLLQNEGINLAANYGIRKGSTYLHNYGISLDAAAKKADIIPEGMIRDAVNPVVRSVAETATHPQALIFIAGVLMALMPQK